MKKFLILILPIVGILCACTFSKHSRNDGPIIDEPFAKDEKGMDILTNQFSSGIDEIWGVHELLQATSKDYVQYTNNYYTRTHISFDEGKITFETIINNDSSVDIRNRLKKTIIHTLLMGDEPTGIFLSTTDNVAISKTPFLTGQVLDANNKPIRTITEAKQYADYLLANKLSYRNLRNGARVAKLDVLMVARHVDIRAKKFLPIIRKNSRKYNVDENLILAIMKVESSFNPYAVSRSNAIGLMQIVPSTAGLDVMQKMYNRNVQPTRQYLYNPVNNITFGTAYLSLLQQEYFNEVQNSKTRKYLMISSYNAGGGATLRMFHQDKATAIAMINKALPDQIHNALLKRHPSQQARRYLEKVLAAEKQIKNIL